MVIKFECIINGKRVDLIKYTIEDAKQFIRKCKYSKSVHIINYHCDDRETLEELFVYEERIYN